ncbi:DUF6507 family protein [Streptomyces hesseae]|uniref:DUF6507 family protein n=1 Tax=Streptomyces hesseae TaxID=3075519 RepID=A0ABU2STY6_9ACTN|nr:DUF6507 family protein [Streptomyces sp. DSM 40473]MDT0452391.1 DUF6507 family protein [Streptomyces sp. DSM 40473]
MSRWDIKPDGVRGVVGKTAEIAGKLASQATSYVGHVESAAGHAGRLAGPCDAGEGLVGMALMAYANHATPELTHIAVRAKKSLQGAVDATTAYAQGDMEMAATTQRTASQAPTPEELGGPKK